MANKKMNVEGTIISVREDNYISITDIVKQGKSNKPAFVVLSWLKNHKTLLFLKTWEKVHNDNFKVDHMDNFRMKALEENYRLTTQKYINETNAIGLISKSGRYGGTYAHPDIAINFCYWYNPEFQVYLIKEFQRLKEEEVRSLDKSSEWHVRLITDRIDDVRNLLDSIPHQDRERNRLLELGEEE